MIPYNQLIDELLIGDTPIEKYDNLKTIMYLLRAIAYPKRGTEEETMTIQDVATMIQDWFRIEDLMVDEIK